MNEFKVAVSQTLFVKLTQNYICVTTIYLHYLQNASQKRIEKNVKPAHYE